METIGKVTSVRKDRKGIKLDDGNWYSNTFKPALEVNVGDEVKVEYTLKGEYRNHQKVEVTSKGQGFKANFNPAIAEQGDKARKNMCISYAKDMYIAELNALLPKCKDLKEAEKVMTERRNQLSETANNLFNLTEMIPFPEVPKEPTIEKVEKVEVIKMEVK